MVGYPREEEYATILERTTGDDEIRLEPVSSAAEIRDLRHTARQVPVPEHARSYAIRLVMATQPQSEYAPGIVNQFVTLGSSPRGAQALLLGGKVRALLAGRYAVACEDLSAIAKQVLRHRVLLGFQGRAEGITPDAVVDEVLQAVPAPQEAAL